MSAAGNPSEARGREAMGGGQGPHLRRGGGGGKAAGPPTPRGEPRIKTTKVAQKKRPMEEVIAQYYR